MRGESRELRLAGELRLAHLSCEPGVQRGASCRFVQRHARRRRRLHGPSRYRFPRLAPVTLPLAWGVTAVTVL
jgi:hypothetical protein